MDEAKLGARGLRRRDQGAQALVVEPSGPERRLDGFRPVPRECISSDHDLTTLLEIIKSVDEEGEHEGDVYRMTLLKAATGARFSQLRASWSAIFNPSCAGSYCRRASRGVEKSSDR